MKRLHLILVAIFAFFEGISHFGGWNGDSSGYVSITHIFMRTANATEWADTIHWHGYLRPMVPALATPLSFLVGAQVAIATVNLVFLILGAVFTGLIVERATSHLRNNDLFGLIGGLLYASAAPNLIWGVAILVDGPGYAMLAVGFYWLMGQSCRSSIYRVIGTGVLLGVALLVKETTLILVFYLGIMTIIALIRKDANLKQIMVGNIMIAAIALGISVSWGLLAVHTTYLGDYSAGITYAGGYAGPLLHPRLFYDSVIRSFYLLLPFVFLGFFTLSDRELKSYIPIVLSVLCLVFGWGTLPESRFTFLLFPAVVPIAVLGMSYGAEKLAGVWSWTRILTYRQWMLLMVIVMLVYTNYAVRSFIQFPKG